jgi:hypothetical protein
MSNAITIRVEGEHGSISGLEWTDVPPFAVITGVNGTGKTQLLEVLAHHYGVWRPRNVYRGAPPPQMNAQASIEGASFERSEVFHSYGDWTAPTVGGTASEQQVEEAVRNARPSQGQPVWEDLTARLGITIDEAQNLSTEEIYENLTPGQLLNIAGQGWNNANMAFLFLSYQLFERDALEPSRRGWSEDQVRRVYGEPPWLILRKSACRIPHSPGPNAPESPRSAPPSTASYPHPGGHPLEKG